MAGEDFSRGSVAIRGLVRVCDTDVEDRGLTTGPEAVDGEVATEFWGRFGAVGAVQWYILT